MIIVLPPLGADDALEGEFTNVFPIYPEGSTIRRVRGNATISWKGTQQLIGEGLIGQDIEIRPAQTDGIFALYYCHRLIGSLDIRKTE